jgi:hypothetical protein
MGKAIAVECYAGYKADERPTSFTVDGETLGVDEVLDRWYDADANYFRVLARDGTSYLLKHDLESDSWELLEQGSERVV